MIVEHRTSLKAPRTVAETENCQHVTFTLSACWMQFLKFIKNSNCWNRFEIALNGGTLIELTEITPKSDNIIATFVFSFLFCVDV